MTTFHIEQFGCRATQADGAAIERQLRDRGCRVALSAAQADVVVVNTCTVTSAADAQARDAIRKIHARNPQAQVIVTGCYAQRAPEELAALPGVAWVVGNSHKPQIPDLAARLQPLAPADHSPAFVPVHSLASSPIPLADNPAKILTGDIFSSNSLLAAPVLGGEGHHTRPVLKIQDGCNNRCAYCVIPFVRGKSRSLEPRLVIEELQRLSAAGHREIVLSGINLGAYGRDLSPRFEFEDLLRKILDETSVERLRISSIEPLDVTRDLVELFASTPRFARHFHVPLQSGSDRLLAAMHRWYRAEHYARRLELIRERLPGAAIGADVIAGFPGETHADHSATMSFIERLPFTYLHVFSFSSRPGTQAAGLPHQLSGAVIKQRARELRALGESKAAQFRRSQVGKQLHVLTLRPDENLAAFTTPAISSNFLHIRVRGIHPPNETLTVSILGEEGNKLFGMVEVPYAASDVGPEPTV